MSRVARKPELMSPAGGMPQLHAAIEAGADAVYFGLEGFNARAKAMSFNHENLPEVVAGLHERGVMAFVAMNTLVFDSELEHLVQEIEGIAESGADAIIVQDIGAIKLAHQIAPELPIHASTQMTITSAEGAELARSLGVSRAVLARELSLKDIELIKKATDLELEVFVHGALCVSYSGQCFSSEAWGGRSANRGACAQACRMPYDLMVDGEERDLGEFRYLLSPQDLFALEQIPELIRIGVDCLKIEGRYKDAEYVAAATNAYRLAIDSAWNEQGLNGAGRIQDSPLRDSRRTKFLLEGVYSRGLLPAFMQGVNHQTVVHGRAPRHRGTRVGTVVDVSRTAVLVQLEGEYALGGVGVIKPGDGLVFDAAQRQSIEHREEGGAVFEVFEYTRRGSVRLEDSRGLHEVELRFGNRAVRLENIERGDWVWRSNDPSIERELRYLTQASKPISRKPVQWQVIGKLGQPLALTVTDDAGRVATSQTEDALKPAERRPLDTRALEVELGKLGETPFYLETIEIDLEDGCFLPLSSLGQARRAAIDALLELRREVPKRTINKTPLTKTPSFSRGSARSASSPSGAILRARSAGGSSSSPFLSVLVRKPDQLEAAIETRPNEIVLDYLELYGLRPSVERILESGIRAVVASPRVLKPAEERISTFLLSLPVDGILVRPLGLLHSLLETPTRPELLGDFSLNAANAISTTHLLEMGLTRLAPTHDLNAAQILELAKNVDASKLEVILHHHLPVFHTEHCVFCRFMSSGTDHTNCGHPCETHSLALRDHNGFEHPVLADVGCRNTVFEARAQSGGRFLETWRAAGIGNYRLEFVQESPEALEATVRAYRKALEGKIDAKTLQRELEKHAPQGTTQGSFIIPPDSLLPMSQM
jgi:U32 family peptidase